MIAGGGLWGLRERLLQRISVDERGCWIWNGSQNVHGYGKITYRNASIKKTLATHRVAFEIWNGKIPVGLDIDHLCRNRLCFNPNHLECVTERENTLRGIGPSAMAAKKTHCPSGHAYSGRNLVVNTDGRRCCRQCQRAAERRYRSKKSSLPAPPAMAELPPSENSTGGGK